jgi:hypothetical protein
MGLLQHDQAYLFVLELRCAPVEEIIVQIAIARSELELIQKRLVVHHVERIEHVVALVLRDDQRVLHQCLQGVLLGHRVEGVRCSVNERLVT